MLHIFILYRFGNKWAHELGHSFPISMQFLPDISSLIRGNVLGIIVGFPKNIVKLFRLILKEDPWCFESLSCHAFNTFDAGCSIACTFHLIFLLSWMFYVDTGTYVLLITSREEVGSCLGFSIFHVTSMRFLSCNGSLKHSKSQEVWFINWLIFSLILVIIKSLIG